MAKRRYVVDTHTLLWFLTDDGRLGRTASHIFGDSTAHLIVPVIAVAEALFLIEKKRVPTSITEEGLLAEIRQDGRIEIAPLDEPTLAATLACKAIPEMHDRQIVATALLAQRAGFDVVILTRDGAIKDANLVPTLW